MEKEGEINLTSTDTNTEYEALTETAQEIPINEPNITKDVPLQSVPTNFISQQAHQYPQDMYDDSEVSHDTFFLHPKLFFLKNCVVIQFFFS